MSDTDCLVFDIITSDTANLCKESHFVCPIISVQI